MQKTVKQDAYALLRSIHMGKRMTENTKRAIVLRLQVFLDNENERFKNWQECNKLKLNLTRQRSVERRFIKRIQAMKIVIHFLSPNDWRVEDEPSFIVKRIGHKK